MFLAKNTEFENDNSSMLYSKKNNSPKLFV